MGVEPGRRYSVHYGAERVRSMAMVVPLPSSPSTVSHTTRTPPVPSSGGCWGSPVKHAQKDAQKDRGFARSVSGGVCVSYMSRFTHVLYPALLLSEDSPR